MGASSSAPRAACRPAGRRNHEVTYTRERSTSRTDAACLRWLEVALRDGLGVEAQHEHFVIGYCDTTGSVDVATALGSGPTLRSAIDAARAREDAASEREVSQ